MAVVHGSWFGIRRHQCRYVLVEGQWIHPTKRVVNYFGDVDNHPRDIPRMRWRCGDVPYFAISVKYCSFGQHHPEEDLGG